MYGFETAIGLGRAAVIFSGIPRYRLLRESTPLGRLERLGRALGHDGLYIKRDDLMPVGMGGNKLRNIEFWLGECFAQGADLLIVAGGVASNQCRLVAAAAALADVECHILHSAPEPDASEVPTGNALLNELLGVKRVYLGALAEAERNEAARRYAAEREREGRRPYIAGAPVPGALGYVAAALELHAQAERVGADIRHVVVAGSMGPTEAGLLWGSALLGGAFAVHMPSVEYEAAELRRLVLEICDGISQRMGFAPPVPYGGLFRIYDDFLGGGYDLPTAESLAAVRRLAALEGIFVETTYNAKVFHALEALVRRGDLPPGEGVCVLHTGGIPALFGQGGRFLEGPR